MPSSTYCLILTFIAFERPTFPSKSECVGNAISINFRLRSIEISIRTTFLGFINGVTACSSRRHHCLGSLCAFRSKQNLKIETIICVIATAWLIVPTSAPKWRKCENNFRFYRPHTVSLPNTHLPIILIEPGAPNTLARHILPSQLLHTFIISLIDGTASGTKRPRHRQMHGKSSHRITVLHTQRQRQCWAGSAAN